MHPRYLVMLLGLLIAIPQYKASGEENAFEACRALGRGINLGNMLEAPHEGEWGQRFQDDFAKQIADAGFSHVRLPVKWSAHAEMQAPYRLDPAFVARVKHVIHTCLQAKLRVVLNIHHYSEIDQDPETHRARFIGLWTQLSQTFKDAPPEVVFELLNEPNSKLTTAIWNDYAQEALREVRTHHTERYVIIGPGRWNSFEELSALQLPADDQRLIATFHYYLPFEFTHQGAPWLEKNAPKTGRVFPLAEREVALVQEHFEQVAAWSKKEKRPIYLGEFGAFQAAPMESRIAWTQLVRETATKHQFAWAYWEFCSGFGAFDASTMRWREPLRDALIPSN